VSGSFVVRQEKMDPTHMSRSGQQLRFQLDQAASVTIFQWQFLAVVEPMSPWRVAGIEG
jgi:hypothetical protein